MTARLTDEERYRLAIRAFGLMDFDQKLDVLERAARFQYDSGCERFFEAVHDVIESSDGPQTCGEGVAGGVMEIQGMA